MHIFEKISEAGKVLLETAPYMTVYFQLGYSFGMLASDTPTNDQNSVSFITPSPVVGEGHAPKAPMKKV